MRLIVIGGGAAGFFCAVNAAQLSSALEVIIVEKGSKLLSKVRISGGGRCNVTHACFSIPEMSKKYPRGGNFVKKTFHQFFTDDTITWFKDRGVLLKTEPDGRMFPVTDSSETVIACLMNEARKNGVQIRLNKEVRNITKNGGLWKVEYADSTTDAADFICVATGGYPKSSMFKWITETGHHIEEPVPSLFTFNMPGNSITALMGISVYANVRIEGTKMEESGPLLITHWGVSGPAVLKLSARAARELNSVQYRFTVIINWTPEYHEHSLREMFITFRTDNASQKIMNRNSLGLPKRLWEYLCSISEIGEQLRWADLSTQKQNLLIRHLCMHTMKVEGKTTYKEEFVTAGGVHLSEIDPGTMQSKILGGLYFAGEILDVDGITGGFNFQHAWTSGWIAAKSIAGGKKGDEG